MADPCRSSAVPLSLSKSADLTDILFPYTLTAPVKGHEQLRKNLSGWVLTDYSAISLPRFLSKKEGGKICICPSGSRQRGFAPLHTPVSSACWCEWMTGTVCRPRI